MCVGHCDFHLPLHHHRHQHHEHDRPSRSHHAHQRSHDRDHDHEYCESGSDFQGQMGSYLGGQLGLVILTS